jgi:heat shock protein HslJ
MTDRRAPAVVLALVLASAYVGAASAPALAQARSPRERPPVTGTFALSGTEWVIEEIDGRPALGGERNLLPPGYPLVSFPSTGGILVKACNNMLASISAPGGQALKIDRGPWTAMACPEEYMHQWILLQGALSETTSYRHEGAILWLLDGRGTARVRLRQAR